MLESILEATLEGKDVGSMPFWLQNAPQATIRRELGSYEGNSEAILRGLNALIPAF